MTNKIILFTFLCISQILSAQQQLTITDYQQAENQLPFKTAALMDRMDVRPNWESDEVFWYRTLDKDGPEYVHYDVSKKERKVFKEKKELMALVSEKESPKYNRRKEVLSPDGKKVVYIKNWNLWVKELSAGTEKQLTFDGKENYGYATDNAGWRQSDRPVVLWSPDSKKIATYRQDQRHVSDMHLVTTNVGAPTLKSWKYPLPEDEKVIQIERVIIGVENTILVRFDMPADPRRGTLCDDISCTGKFDDNQWTSDSKRLYFVSTTRDHKVAQLRVANALTGEVKDILKEEVATQYESGQDAINWHYLEATNEVIWYSERDNWGHLYLYNATNGQLNHQITKGDFVVTRIKHIDEKKGYIYFEANGKEAGRDPYYSHFYRVDISGENLMLLTPDNGHHRLRFSPNHKYFIDNYSQPDVPPVHLLRDMEGQLIDTLERGDISRLVESGWQPPKNIKVRSADGKFDLYGLMFSPKNLDENKKYPIVNYVYPGPQGGGVGSRSFSASRRGHQALAELGFVVVVIDGTCNPGRSKAFHDACYGDMSVNTLPDQIAGLRQLALSHPYMDLDKVGIYGHSGGGFAAASALFKYPDFYDVGVAQSGNHDNRNYEDDWGERYVGLMKENDKGVNNYEQQANQLYAENLKGKLLLAHGGMDDNVPPYNTHLVVDALIKANKDFDLIIYPNARHGYGADNLYMTRRRWDYFVKNLRGEEPPKEYKIERTSDPRLKKARP